MNRDWEDEFIVLAVEVVEMVSPDVFHVSSINKPVAVGRRFDEHHRRKVVYVPISRNLDEASLLSLDKWLHPFLRLLGVVDLRPSVSSAKVVCLTIVVTQTVIVFDAI